MALFDLQDLFIFLLTSCSYKKEYNVVGVILDRFPERNELSIHHDEIPNFMMAMTMNFRLADHLKVADFEIGDSVHFKLLYLKNDVICDINVKYIASKNVSIW